MRAQIPTLVLTLCVFSYVDEDYDCEGSTILCKYEGEDGATPHFYFMMKGFAETKY